MSALNCVFHQSPTKLTGCTPNLIVAIHIAFNGKLLLRCDLWSNVKWCGSGHVGLEVTSTAKGMTGLAYSKSQVF